MTLALRSVKIISAENIDGGNKAACQSIPSFRTTGKHTNSIQALLPILKIGKCL